MTKEIQSFSLIDEILESWKEKMGDDYKGYRNHATRMLNFCLYLYEANEEEKKKLTIAAAFHDIGIWRGAETTADYIDPSVREMELYLVENKLEHWTNEIKTIIEEHHKITPYNNLNYPLVEVFRRADLVDFSLGAIKLGVDKEYIKKVKETFPNENFHKTLWRLTKQQIKREPFNPAPMMKI